MTDKVKLKWEELPYALKEAMNGREISKEEYEIMTPLEVMQEYSAWELGDPYWADVFIKNYEQLRDGR